MFNNGNVDPMYHSDHQQCYNRPFFNCNSKHDHHQDQNQDQDQLPFPFFHLPNSPFSSSCYDQLQLNDHHHHHHDLFLHQSHDDLLLQPQQPLRPITTSLNMDSNNELTKIFNKSTSTMPKKKSSKRDRHSKINTAQGPRDRRMRLSLKVAREFFDLQDKLCFDKASKTVEWLLIHARSAIKKLSSGGLSHHQMMMSAYTTCSGGTKTSASPTSECEVISEIDEAAIASNGSKPSSSSVRKGKKPKTLRKTAYHPLARELRDKARARARERTREKQRSQRIIDESKLNDEVKNQQLNNLSSWSPFETNAEESATQSHTTNKNNPSLDQILAEIESSHDHHTTDQGMIDDSLVIMGKWSPSFIINHLNITSIPQEMNNQITDLQSVCKSWEVVHYYS